MERREVLGVPVDVTTEAAAVATVDRFLSEGGRRGYVLAVNPEKVVKLREMSELLEFFRGATLLLLDGVGLVGALWFLERVRASRVAGADMCGLLCELAAERGYSVFLFGAKEEVSAAAEEALQQRYPGIQVAGRRNGYVSASEMDGLIEEINAVKPDLLFVALGSPRQEEWLMEHLDALDVGVVQTVGGTLDTIVGTVKRAPRVAQRLGMEWAWRMARQPKRALRNPALVRFVAQVVREKARF